MSESDLPLVPSGGEFAGGGFALQQTAEIALSDRPDDELVLQTFSHEGLHLLSHEVLIWPTHNADQRPISKSGVPSWQNAIVEAVVQSLNLELLGSSGHRPRPTAYDQMILCLDAFLQTMASQTGHPARDLWNSVYHALFTGSTRAVDELTDTASRCWQFLCSLDYDDLSDDFMQVFKLQLRLKHYCLDLPIDDLFDRLKKSYREDTPLSNGATLPRQIQSLVGERNNSDNTTSAITANTTSVSQKPIQRATAPW